MVALPWTVIAPDAVGCVIMIGIAEVTDRIAAVAVACTGNVLRPSRAVTVAGTLLVTVT
jgi:hypothetical protein